MATKKQAKASAESAPAPAEVASPSAVAARVLVRCPYGQPNDVVEVSASVAAGDPALDPDPGAVAYARGLSRPKEE